ncbi:hypothetical protein Ahy_B07g086654 [Arachis hypogaea]|uniref:Uncharacterized protein n=1 Tax=Arachis hypogaea TaxID=3818 RepID=A0A444YA65_ARAHY|nr:hypothetical protein Ahy_B07g086654 [Arachis hypogaea]
MDVNTTPRLDSLCLGIVKDTNSEFSVEFDIHMDDSRGEGVGEGGGDASGTYGDSKVKFTDDNNSFKDVNEDEMIQYGEVASLSVADLLKQVWDNLEDVMDLEVRKGDFGKDYNGKLVRYQCFFFCTRDGLRENNHYNRIVIEHNHELAPVGMVHLIANHRELNETTKAQIDGMNVHGITTSKILRRAKIADGDANTTLVYLEGKAGSDPMLVARYNMTADKRLENLILADKSGQSNYQYFSNEKQVQQAHFFSSANNHNQTIIFGFGLLIDESVSSYRLMLENLLEVMCQKKPLVIVTNGDKVEVLLEVSHRLCVWYVEKNVTYNVKDENLKTLFKRWLYSDMEIEKFEAD